MSNAIEINNLLSMLSELDQIKKAMDAIHKNEQSEYYLNYYSEIESRIKETKSAIYHLSKITK